MSDWCDFIVARDDHAYHQGLDVTVPKDNNFDNGSYDISSCMTDGSTSVAMAVQKIVEQVQTIPTINARFLMLQRGIQVEQRGMRLTGKAPACSAIVKREFYVKKGLSKKKTGEVFSVLLTLANMALRDIESFEIWYNNRVEWFE
tara:strand:- start:1362 stop:1796 length:435 start_codon:yes stop_codon:yes gene_type:complete